MNFTNSNSNNKGNHGAIREQQPIYRSIEVSSNRSDALLMRRTQYFTKVGSSSSSQQEIAVTKTKNARWAVVQASPVPVWGIDATAVLVEEPASIVSARIDQSLRLRSVEAQFDDNRAEAVCRTSKFIHYKVFLYAGPHQDSTYVEVMKMGGCREFGFSFVTERRAIINAAKCLGAKQDERQTTLSIPKLTIPKELLHLYVPPSISDLEETLDRAGDQLHSNNRHSMLFALQNLVSMTSGDKVNTATAYDMCKLIMQNYSDIRDTLVAVYAVEAGNTDDDVSLQICNAVLCVLINGMVALSNSKDAVFVDAECKRFVEQLVLSLMEGIGSYECSHNACLALDCLSLLVQKSPLACMKVREINAKNIIEAAEVYGKREHLKLEEAARNTMGVLQNRLVSI